jgi:hypothetical protein
MDRRGASGKSRGPSPSAPRPDPIDQFRLAADDIDRILRGEKPCRASQQKVGRRRQLRVGPGKPQTDDIESASPPGADVTADMAGGPRRANTGSRFCLPTNLVGAQKIALCNLSKMALLGHLP